MFDAVARELAALSQRRRPCDPPSVVENAHIESFGIHFRNLAEFLWPTRLTKNGERRTPKKGDVVAGHFAPGWIAPEPTNLNDTIERVNREIGHLTLARRPGKHPDKQWDLVACIRMLRPLALFVSQARTAGRLPDGVAPAVAQLLALVSEVSGLAEPGFHVNATSRLGRSS